MRNWTHRKNIVVACTWCAVISIIALLAGLSSAEEITGPGIIKRTMPRKYDVIEVSGDLLRRFEEVPIKNLSLLALRSGILSPIPFQIDERDLKGHYVMTGGPNAGRDEDSGKLDANDELVFLVADAGDRLPEKDRLAGGSRIEIEMTDPRYSKQHAWAYLAKYETTAPRSDVDSVDYDPVTERIISKRMVVGYRKGFMFYNEFLCPKLAGGSGVDIMDRMKLRFKVDFFGGRLPLVRNEEAVTAKVTGWIDGPVRVIQVTENKLKLFDMLPSLSFDGMSEYYPHFMSSPILIKVPFDMNRIAKVLGIRRVIVETYADLPGMIGGRAYSNLDDINGFKYTGHTPKEVIDGLDLKGIVWGYATKKGVATWFPRLIFPDPLYQFNELYMSDDVNMNNPPDDQPGELGSGLIMDMLAYPKEITFFADQKSFELRFETYYASPGLTPEGAREWLDMQDYLLFIDVHGGDPDETRQKKKAGAGPPCPPWKGGYDGVITDTRGREIPLRRIAFFIGSSEVDARLAFGGERVSDQTSHKIDLAKINSLTNYYVDYEPVTKTHMAMFSKLNLKDGSTLDLLGCKMCGWAGCDETGRVIYLPNSQVKRIDFKPIQ